MAEDIRVVTDRALQVIRLYFRGTLDIRSHETIKRLTDETALDLDDPECLLMLLDGRHVGIVDADARRALRSDLGEGRPRAAAVYGVALARRMFVSTLFRTSGIDTIRFFDTEKAAVAWLLERRKAACA